MSRSVPGFLTGVLDYLDVEYRSSYEILVVDDGNSDATACVVKEIFGVRPNIRLIRHGVNRGKGAAVQIGMLAARGQLRFFADADGATPIEEERRLRRAIEGGADVVIGSRAAREIR